MNTLVNGFYETAISNKKKSKKVTGIEVLKGYLFENHGYYFGISNRDVKGNRLTTKKFRMTELTTGALVGVEFEKLDDAKVWEPDEKMLALLDKYVDKNNRKFNDEVIGLYFTNPDMAEVVAENDNVEGQPVEDASDSPSMDIPS